MHEPEDESKDLHGDLYDTLCGVHYLPVPRHSREGDCGFDHFIVKSREGSFKKKKNLNLN